ncbi:MAG TPA: hypothetical protein P5084_09165 [Paludibacter sp.]|nr:hypothetical protein [Paludibacter sp.]
MRSVPTHIRRNVMLQEMDIRRLPNGNRILFSVKFVSNSGNLHFFPLAFSCGLPWNVKKSRMRGIQPCDKLGNPIDHVYPVGIDNFLMYNQMHVIL